MKKKSVLSIALALGAIVLSGQIMPAQACDGTCKKPKPAQPAPTPAPAPSS